MTLRMRKFSIAVTLKGEVEAESPDEALRIVEGVIANGACVVVYEGDPTEPDDEVKCTIADLGPVLMNT